MPQELLIALIAAGAALSGSLLGSFLTRSTEHQQWLRNKKHESYTKFLGLAFSFATMDRIQLETDLAVVLAEIRIYASAETYLAVADIYEVIMQLIHAPTEDEERLTGTDFAERLGHLSALLRKDLGTD